MQVEPKPLFSLTIGEFIALTKKLVEEVITEKMQDQSQQEAVDINNGEEFNIEGLMGFLKCSKASVHNYKKLGLPFYRIGRTILFRKQEVLNFMKGLKNRKAKH